jgi:hypothetical protein
MHYFSLLLRSGANYVMQAMMRCGEVSGEKLELLGNVEETSQDRNAKA